MSDYRETVTTRNNENTDTEGARVQEQTKKIHTSSQVSGTSIAVRVTLFIVGIIETALAFRFILKLLGANPSSGFVDFVYKATDMLTAPFDSMFGVVRASSGSVVHSVFEPSILVAAAVYALIGWGVTKLLSLNQPE